MQVEWFTDYSGFERLEPEWNNLLHRSVTDTVFLTFEYQTTWMRNLGTGDPCLVTVRESDGMLVGILPLFWEGGASAHRLSLIGCVDVSDYLDVIVEKGKEEDVYAALLDTLLRPDFPAWKSLQFCTLPASSPTNVRFKELAESRGLHVDWHLHDVAPIIELPTTWEAYLSTLDKKQRHEVRRKLRRVEEAGGRWYAIHAKDELDAAVMDFVELHKKSQPDKHLFMDTRMQQFFIEMARALQPQGWIQLEFLEVDGERAASLFDFTYQNRIFVYNSGYDPQKYGALSPGVSLFAISIQQAISAGRSMYDFLRGNEDYKYRFGAKDTLVHELHIQR